MRRLVHLTLIAASLILAPTAAAQQGEPERPGLGRGKDANDWEAYFEHGDAVFARYPAQAVAAFYWASRLDPTRAEPLFARWAAFYQQNSGTWREWLDRNPVFMERPEVMANDSLAFRAFRRNPFVHRGLEAALYQQLGREIRWDGPIRAFMDYGEGNFRQASEAFGRMVRSDPARNFRYRHWLMLSLVGAGQVDSATVELTHMLQALRGMDQSRMTYYYESKALQEYALGMLHESRGRSTQARQAWERALVEDLTMYPARAALARLALRDRKSAEAVDHLAQAVEIAPEDAVMHYEHGNALMAANRRADAITAYQRAIQLEPYWANPYLRLGVAHDNDGKPAEAIAAYRAFLDRAPRRMTAEIQRITERIAQLQAGG